MKVVNVKFTLNIFISKNYNHSNTSNETWDKIKLRIQLKK